MLKGFREFVLRGNVIDLAVVIGAAFTLVNAVVQWLITPLIAAIFGKPDLDDVMTFTINGAEFSIGAVLTALINLALVAAAVYFVLIVPMNKPGYARIRRGGARGAWGGHPASPEIRDLLRDRQPLGP